MRREEKKETQKKPLWILVPILAAAVAIGIFAYTRVQHGRVTELLAAEGIYQGVTIDGVEVGGLSQEEALALLEQDYTDRMDGQVLTLTFGEDEWEIPFAEVGAGYDVAGAVQTAYETGRTGTEDERFATGKTLLQTGIDVPVAYTYDAALLEEKLNAVAEEFDRPAEDSKVSRVNGKFSITEEKEGREMDKTQTTADAAAVLETHESGRAEITATVTEPKITAADNAEVTDLIGSFTTTFTNSDKNRNNNLVVGCQYINGTMLAPGETFSANAELGSQTAAGGYRNAGVYVNGKVEQGMAGGVCQVTTTLYNAAIFAELEIVERHPHSMTVGYVPLGRDAAIAGDYKDLKFKNNTDAPILLEAYAANGKLVMNIYGKETHSAGRKVEFETVYEATVPKPAEIVTEDPEKPEGEREVTSQGRTGCKVSVYKKVYENGKQVSREWFSSSSYRATADEVTVGTKKAETEPAMASEYPADAPWMLGIE